MTMTRHLMALALLAIIAVHLPICSHGLPITSEPLDNNPDHLAWESTHTIKSYSPDIVRKIPKSIFITPNFNDSTATCKPGYRLDPRDNKCYKEHIPVNQQSLLAMQALQAFGNQQSGQTADSYSDSTEYDYDEQEESRYEIPISYSFAGDSSTTSVTDPKSFLNGGTRAGAAAATTTNGITRRTTDSLPATHANVESTTATTTTTTKKSVEQHSQDVAPVDVQYVDTVAPKETETEAKITKRTGETKKPVPVTEAVVTTTTDVPTESETTEIPTTESVLFNTIPTTTNEDHHIAEGGPEMIAQNKLAVAQFEAKLSETQNIKSPETSAAEGDEELQKELKAESLFRDERPSETTTSVDDLISTTTDQSENRGTTEVPDTTTIVPEPPTDETKIVTDRLEMEKPVAAASSTIQPIIVIPTKDRIQIVTPEAPESSTHIVDTVIAATEQLHKQMSVETEATKRQRQTIINNEMKADALDTIDQHNRFVYAHLETSPTDAPTTSQPPASTTPQPAHPTPRLNLRQQLAFFHLRNEENKRARLGDANRAQSLLFSNHRSGSPATSIRFDNSPASIGHQRSGDRSQPLFTWLPTNWKFERTGGRDGRPTIKERPGLKFWKDMPLIRDPGLSAGGESTDRAARANSRSPTEQLFRQEESEVPAVADAAAPSAEDVYKVVSIKNAQQYQNR